ncbi:hypothetical protein DFJ77DRAFT_474723 [Powellomyces hirtus]|nr:hypothetical protein DFJ77DRAFT_474723 [Powellomyces hirtus]
MTFANAHVATRPKDTPRTSRQPSAVPSTGRFRMGSAMDCDRPIKQEPREDDGSMNSKTSSSVARTSKKIDEDEIRRILSSISSGGTGEGVNGNGNGRTSVKHTADALREMLQRHRHLSAQNGSRSRTESQHSKIEYAPLDLRLIKQEIPQREYDHVPRPADRVPSASDLNTNPNGNGRERTTSPTTAPPGGILRFGRSSGALSSSMTNGVQRPSGDQHPEAAQQRPFVPPPPRGFPPLPLVDVAYEVHMALLKRVEREYHEDKEELSEIETQHSTLAKDTDLVSQEVQELKRQLETKEAALNKGRSQMNELEGMVKYLTRRLKLRKESWKLGTIKAEEMRKRQQAVQMAGATPQSDAPKNLVTAPQSNVSYESPEKRRRPSAMDVVEESARTQTASLQRGTGTHNNSGPVVIRARNGSGGAIVAPLATASPAASASANGKRAQSAGDERVDSATVLSATHERTLLPVPGDNHPIARPRSTSGTQQQMALTTTAPATPMTTHSRQQSASGASGPNGVHDICFDYNRSECRHNSKTSTCQHRHVCIICLAPHPFYVCTAKRTSCFRFNNEECSSQCHREHRCLRCAAGTHRWLECMVPPAPENGLEYCLTWNSSQNCHSGPKCERRHQCLRCRGSHAVIICPENVPNYFDTLDGRFLPQLPPPLQRIPPGPPLMSIPPQFENHMVPYFDHPHHAYPPHMQLIHGRDSAAHDHKRPRIE